MVNEGDLIAGWFSCGVASAVAAQKTLEEYGNLANIRIVNNPIEEEHEDNYRFLKDVEKWLGVPIEFAVNDHWPRQSCEYIWDKKKYMSGVQGARCTLELKKKARQKWENANNPDWTVLGFTTEEKKRADRFKLTERDTIIPILIDKGISKKECFRIVQEAGIDVPEMYKLGYPNANCIGCVKVTSPTYWNHVRKIHPDVFERRAKQSRELGVKLVRANRKRIFLDELDPNTVGRSMKTVDFECGIFCEENN